MGANPHVIKYSGTSEYDSWSLSGLSNLPSIRNPFKRSTLSNIPAIKSVYFQLRQFNSDMPSAWEYQTGVYSQGHFGQVRGSGGEGTVIEGVLQNQIPAAFKFVEVRDQKFIKDTKDALNDMNERLSEMTKTQLTSGSAILRFEGHYR